MLKIQDLQMNQDLDQQAMQQVTGGMFQGMPFPGVFGFNIGSPINAPKIAEIAGLSSSFTGPVTSNTAQDDRDTITNVGYGQVFNSGGNTSFTNQWVSSFATNDISSQQ